MRSQGSPSPPHSPATPPAEPVPAAGPAPVSFRPWGEVSNTPENPLTNRSPEGAIPPYPERNPGQHPLAATVFLPHFSYFPYSLYSPSVPYIHPGYAYSPHVYPPLQRAAEQTRPSSSAGPSGHPAQSRSSHTQRGPEGPPASKKAKIKPSRPERKEQRADQNPMPSTEDPPQGSSRSSQPSSTPNAVSVIVYHKKNLPAPGSLPAPSPSGSGIVPPRPPPSSPINYGSGTAPAPVPAPAPPLASGGSIVFSNPAPGMKRTQKRHHPPERAPERRPLSSDDGQQASTSGASAQGPTNRMSGPSFSITAEGLTEEGLLNERKMIQERIQTNTKAMRPYRSDKAPPIRDVYMINCDLNTVICIYPLIKALNRWNRSMGALKILVLDKGLSSQEVSEVHKKAYVKNHHYLKTNALSLALSISQYSDFKKLINSRSSYPIDANNPLTSIGMAKNLRQKRADQDSGKNKQHKSKAKTEKTGKTEKTLDERLFTLSQEEFRPLLTIFLQHLNAINNANTDESKNNAVEALKTALVKYFQEQNNS